MKEICGDFYPDDEGVESLNVFSYDEWLTDELIGENRVFYYG